MMMGGHDAAIRIGLIVLAAVLPFLIGRFVFLDSSFTTDENSYMFQARLFLDGAVARPLPPAPVLFQHEMIILDERYGWLSRYSPGHPLWLMPGVALGVPRLMSALAAALGMYWITGVALRLRWPMFGVGFLLLVSPWFLFMHGTLLSHTSGFAMTCLTIWGLVSWMTGGSVRYAAWAGVGWGALYLIRPYTGLLLALPFGLAALIHLAVRRDRNAGLGCAVFAVVSALGGALYLAYNACVTGDPFLATYLVYDSSDALGFGLRHTTGTPIEHTWRRGLEFMLARVALLHRWLWGFPGSLTLAAGLLWIGWRWAWSLLWLSGALIVWLGYVLFYAHTLDNIGPYYYFETLPLLVLGAGSGMARLWCGCARWPRARGLVAGFLALLCVGMSGAFMRMEGSRLTEDRRYEARVSATIRKAPESSVVVLNGIQYDYASGRKTVLNERGTNGNPLVVVYQPGCERLLAYIFPAHRIWMLNRGDEDRLIPMDRQSFPRLWWWGSRMAGYTGQNEFDPTLGREVRVARELRDGAHWTAAKARLWLSPGRYVWHFDIATTDCRSHAPVTLDVVRTTDDKPLGIARLVGSNPRGTVTLDCVVTAITEVEPRIHFGGSGELRVYAIECIPSSDAWVSGLR